MKIELLKRVHLLILVFLLFCCNDDNEPMVFLDSSNLRLTHYKYQTSDMDEPRNQYFEYDEKGRLSKIIDNSYIRDLVYDDSDQLVSDGRFTYHYNDQGNINTVVDKFGDSTVVIYNEKNLVFIEKSYFSSYPEVIIEYTYDEQNRIRENYQYLFLDEVKVGPSYKNYFYFDENENISSNRFEEYDEESNLSWSNETFFKYFESPNPNKLIHKHAGILEKNTFIEFFDFGDSELLFGIWSNYNYYTYNNIESIESYDFSYPYEIKKNYKYNKYGYPSYCKNTSQRISGEEFIWEHYWEYEEY